MKNLIGISGKLQHGKDTVYSMIQDITKGSYENKKFAGKLKEITAILVGCTVEQLEDINFKNKELGEEWRRWYLVDDGTMYDGLLEGIRDPYFFAEEPQPSPGERIESEILTPRQILQIMGTECGRDLIHPNIWVNALFANYTPSSKWIITDLRFPNEAAIIKKMGGVTIRVNRPSVVSTSNHPSEIALDDYNEWDYVITNDGDLLDLYDKVKDILSLELINETN